MLIELLDAVGTFVFALSGGMRAVKQRLDPFGVIFLAFVAANSGGVLRDVLIGATPPVAFVSWHYLAISVVAGLVCFFQYRPIQSLSASVAVFDAIGLGLFAVVGARKALDAGLNPLMAAVIGMLTAVGGGIARDVLTARTPMVLRREIYALAAFVGASVLTFGDFVSIPASITAPLGAGLTTSLRLIALKQGWNLPNARPE